MKVYVDGRDNCGWHMDVERKNIQKSLHRIGIKETTSLFWANIVHNIWWNHLLFKQKPIFRRKKNIIVTSSNFVNLDDNEYSLMKEFRITNKIAKAWIVPSSKQKAVFDKHGVQSYYQPFYLDLSIFKPLKNTTSKNKLLNNFSIPAEIVKNKVLIGSFQRDSLGSDLKKPKWQKGPDFLIKLLKDLPKDNFTLILAGPRRHFVINQCKKHHIPYYYIGTETERDDLRINTLKIKQMPQLYHLIDIYLVTSTSEGGPKAVMEAAATKTFILSTDVGLAADFINKENLFTDPLSFQKRLFDIVNNISANKFLISETVEKQHVRANKILNLEVMDQRLLKIYKDVLLK